MVKRLQEWFCNHKRDLPWREEPTPYRVWVSEVMLQQTQVTVVLPYFERWMARFPTPEALAEASLDEVIKLWEGLGYYSRARNLHAGAKQLVEKYSGEMPSDEVALRSIKGIGDYTVGAIRAFAFRKKAAAVDGNVLRVIARLFGLKSDIGKETTRREIKRRVEEMLPDEAPWEVTEGLIELGATVCKKKPECHRCPLRRECVAYKTGQQNELPIKEKRVVVEELHRVVFIVVSEGRVLLRRGEKGKVMADLYEFPYVEGREWKEMPGVEPMEAWEPVRHGFTRYRVTLYPWLCSGKVDGEWHPIEEIEKLPFSSGHRKIRAQLVELD